MTDILDLPGWTVLSKSQSGGEYLIEAEYAVQPTTCPKCGVIDTPYKHIDGLERELNGVRPPASPDMAYKWMNLMKRVQALDTDARMEARDLVRASFSRIVIWHSGESGAQHALGGAATEIELTARGGGSERICVNQEFGVDLQPGTD